MVQNIKVTINNDTIKNYFHLIRVKAHYLKKEKEKEKHLDNNCINN